MKYLKYSVAASLSTILLSAGMLGMIDMQVFAKEDGSEVGYERKFNSNSNVDFIPSTGTTNPIDPTNPTNPKPEKPNPVKPGTEGPLSIDFASDFDFGTQEITTEDKVYMAKAQTYVDSEKETPNFVQITDKRGSNAGWSLNVKQEHQFKNEETQNKYLEGASIKFAAGEVVSNGKGKKPSVHEAVLDSEKGSFHKVMTAEKTEGSGTWAKLFGSSDGLVEVEKEDDKGNIVKEKRDSGVTLSIPGATQKDAVEYNTTLNWQLTNEPGNGK